MSSSSESQKVRGCEFTNRVSECGRLTQWSEVTPLELKLTIEEEMMRHPEKKIDYDKENECCLCYCALYDNLKEQTVEEVVKIQAEIYKNKISEKVQEKKMILQIVRLGKCQGMHFYHKECLEHQLNSSESKQFIKCAVCNIIYGKQTGEMPSGTMTWRALPFQTMPLEGYTAKEASFVIEIVYKIPSGTLKNGTVYHGTSRAAYLPCNKDGILILSMLAEAFRRKLIFKVGTSITTGQQNVVVWQGIHHKTRNCGGTSNFGYPDPTYFERVTSELQARGVTPDQVKLEDPKKGYIQV